MGDENRILLNEPDLGVRLKILLFKIKKQIILAFKMATKKYLHQTPSQLFYIYSF